MNIKEAYSVLEVAEDISDEELKKKYKTLARKYHPDIFKEDPNKFKLINEAFQLVTDFRQNPSKYEPKIPQGGFWSNMSNIADFFGNMSGEVNQFIKPIKISFELTFAESVLGVSKEVSYKRNVKCDNCNGNGVKLTGNGCKDCDGFGRVTKNNNGMIFQTKCNKCDAKHIKQHKCENCKGKKTLEDTRTGNINIPPGVTNGSVLRLEGEGHFVGRSFFNDSYSDVMFEIKVSSHESMYVEGNDVCSTCKISLLEALKGASKEIETVYGNKTITIPEKTKHSDKIKIPNCGVKTKNGSHIVSIQVEYPEDVSKIIEIL